MIESTVTVRTVTALLLWTAGIIAIGLSFFGPLQLAAIGLLLAGMGGVVQIRGFLCALERRERNAFDLGRDSVRNLR